MPKSSDVVLHGEGRGPWYRVDGSNSEAYLICIAGGSASGKTSVSNRIIKNLGIPWVVIISMDSFYKVLNEEEKARAYANNYDFDHPDAFDLDFLVETLKKMKQGRSVEVPIYDFKTHSRLEETKTIYGATVVVFEGIFALYDKRVLDLMDLKIFVDTDSDVRLARRCNLHHPMIKDSRDLVKRDICERERDLKGVIEQYNRFVKPSFDDHVLPTMRNADVIIPRGLDNIVAIDMITKHIRTQLAERFISVRSQLAGATTDAKPPQSVKVLDQTNQIKGIHTIIRNKNTSRDDFLFYSERLARMVVDAGLAELPLHEKTVTTPTGDTYKGYSFESNICGVSIMRAGASMESSLRGVCKDISIGKILIQTDPRTGEPQLHYCKLPTRLKQRHVLLMDASMATGAAALMGIRVLLDHGVAEDRIIFLTLLAAPSGLHAVARAFPKVRMVTSAVDPGLSSENLYITPGFGNFGDRYFGTENGHNH